MLIESFVDQAIRDQHNDGRKTDTNCANDAARRGDGGTIFRTLLAVDHVALAMDGIITKLATDFGEWKRCETKTEDPDADNEAYNKESSKFRVFGSSPASTPCKVSRD